MKKLLPFILFLAVVALVACKGEQAPPATSTNRPTATVIAAPATPESSQEPITDESPTPEAKTSPTPSPAPQATVTMTPEPSPQATQAEVVEAKPSATPQPSCEEKVAFYGDVTVPDDTRFLQGESFIKTWKVRNEGSCTWGPDYALVFVGGSQMNGAGSSPLPAAEPGDIVEISVELNAPSRGGSYQGDWMLSNPQAEWFGVGASRQGSLWVRIVVDYVPQDGGGGIGGGDGGTQPAACGAIRNTEYESQVLSLINQARTSNGLPQLSSNPQLVNAALAHSNDMACNDFVDHAGSDGSLWYDRITREGYAYSAAKENIYVGDPDFGGTPAGAYEWWMNSQIHRDNILSDNVTEAGIAYVNNPNSTYKGYFTLVLAR